MRGALTGLALAVLLGGCVQYPNGTWGPLPPAPPPGVTVAPPAVAYTPPVYGYGYGPPPGQGVPIYVVPQAPPPVVVAPPAISLGFAFGPGGYYGRARILGAPVLPPLVAALSAASRSPACGPRAAPHCAGRYPPRRPRGVRRGPG